MRLETNGGSLVRQATVRGGRWVAAFVTALPRVEGETLAATVRRATANRALPLERISFTSAWRKPPCGRWPPAGAPR